MHDVVTTDDLVTRLGEDELLQVAGIGSFNDDNGRSLDDEKISEEINFASGLIGSYLLKRYSLLNDAATADIPSILKGYACDIVRYRLRSRSGDRNTVTEETRKRYEDSISWLKMVAEGKTNIDFTGIEGLEGQPQVETTQKVRASIPPSRVENTLSGYLT